MENRPRQPKYWICDHCVKTKHPDWVTAYPNGGNTVVKGLCGHCEWSDEQFLTPTCDYQKPGQPAPEWD